MRKSCKRNTSHTLPPATTTYDRLETLLVNILEYTVNVCPNILPDLIRVSTMSSDELTRLGYEKGDFPILHEMTENREDL